MRKKRWMSIMLVLCMILTLLPINTAYADEADAQKDANQVEEVQSDEDIVMQTEQVEEVKPDESVAMQDEQVEEAKPDESVAMQDVGERCGNYYIGIAGCFDSQRDAEFRTAEVVGLEGNESYVEVMIGVGEEIHHIGNVAARTVVDHYYLEVAGIVLLKHGRKHRGKLAGTVLRVNDDRNARPRLRFGFRHLAGTGLRRASDFGQTAAVCGQEPQNGQQSRRERDPHYRHDPVYREI